MDNISTAYVTRHLDSIKLIRLNSNIHIVKNDKSHISLEIWVLAKGVLPLVDRGNGREQMK